MRGICIVLFLVLALLVTDSDGWRFKGRKFWNRVKKHGKKFLLKFVVKTALKHLLFGRDVHSVDVNGDGNIDQSEAEKLTNENRVARDLLSITDENGDSVVSLDEFERSVRDLMEMDEDELDLHLEDAEYF